jgi:DNA-binding MurR/RpiR family transcriptional regulator
VFRSTSRCERGPDLQGRIAGLLRDGRFRDTNTPHSVLARFASEGIVSLESLQHRACGKDLARAISLIRRRRPSSCSGSARLVPVALHITYVLRKLGRRVALLDGSGECAGGPSRGGHAQGCADCHPLQGYNRDTVRKLSRARGPGIAGCVDRSQPAQPRSSRGAKVVFEIPDMPEAALRTMVAPMCLAQSIAVGLTLAQD